MQNFVDEAFRKLTTMRNVNESEIFHAFLMRLTVLDDKRSHSFQNSISDDAYVIVFHSSKKQSHVFLSSNAFLQLINTFLLICLIHNK